MEAVEINAGAWYLRALRDDERVSDVPALADLGIDDPAAFVRAADRGWAEETGFSWAVCEPTTGELMSLVTAAAGQPATGRARTGQQASLDDALPVVERFLQSL
ncbi:hypothetical protein GOARA_019_00410 [Gordonia araii NBRC 100433]|uniref:Uncharacterized protein n=1 Tax=Gordonia araii NBRC 100433 TaxID=1073574 RepID=G7GYT4_9ACTN|nr:hypothetical protein [Gordonia araii]NNG98940.1 hypothetical protein [Gordonia araii NBRC 100433]GAB08759.1 hypothetical protein GOARA_019_00410 [Gordonia araii NBRC 100433]